MPTVVALYTTRFRADRRRRFDLSNDRRRPSTGNLAGPPARWSSPVGTHCRGRREYQGFVKLRLVHGKGRSFLMPDVLIGVGELRYFLPSFFSPCVISFNVEPGKHVAELSLDVGSSRAAELERVVVRFRSEDRILAYEDGAQLYRCSFEGPRAIAHFAKGECRRGPGDDFLLRVFHHTTAANAAAIISSKELWSSPWNLAGTRRLSNVSYGYFTSLPTIRSEEDLRLVAMASDEVIQFQTTSDRIQEEVLSLKVYRGNTRDRTSALPFDVPCGAIAPSHLLLHPFVGREPAYYEVVGPEIVRVGVKPSAKLRLTGTEVGINRGDAKRFDYVVVGDAATVDGLAAPYAEEETRQIVHLEKLDVGMDLFDFWLQHQNSDQVTGRSFEPRQLQPF